MNKLLQFLKEVREEFKNITWPKRDALIQLTIVVISISIIISLILGGFDYLFINLIASLGQLKSSPATQKVTAPLDIPTPQASGTPLLKTSPVITPAIKK
ncbi:MAG TPA: preprotein translocase subunit SecE [Patescibacteria group bacterium]